MTTIKNDIKSRKFLSWQAIVAISFSVLLVLGSSGIGLGGLSLQQQQQPRQAYAQEDSGETNTFPDESVPPETDTTVQVEICDNFVDDDGNGFTDSEDPEGCTPPSLTCVQAEILVNPDCPTSGSQPTFEVCDNFVDDDGNGLIDEDCPTPVPSGDQPGGSQPTFEARYLLTMMVMAL